MTNDGKFWGPVCDGERVVAWMRVDSPVPGAIEALHAGVPMRFLRFRNGMIARLSDAERKEILDAEAAEAAQRETDAAEAAAQREAEAAEAAAALLALESELDNAERITKGLALTILDALNRLSARIREGDAAVAAATSLADLKTRTAALSAVPDRTAEQLKAAVKAKVQEL
jgi:hypothetical protein